MAEPLIDRRLLEKLERLTIRWQRSFAGLVGGHNPSHYSGPGQEFLDHRNFHTGDDLRAVNWRAYLRLEKLFLKMFQVEPRTPVRIMVDCSRSMGAGTDDNPTAKFDYARRVAGALVYVGLVRHDTITLVPFSDTIEESSQASGGRHRFGPVSDFLTALEPHGRSDFLTVARQFLSRYPKPGLLIVISDFLSEDDILRPLKYLADFGNELLLLQVWSPSEREPQLSGEFSLEDAESSASLQLTLDAEACARYTAAFDAHAKQIETLAIRNGGRYTGMPSSIPLEDALFAALEMPPVNRGAGRIA